MAQESVFNHMVDVTVNWAGTQINTLNSWNGTLQNWTDTNQNLMQWQVDDEICYEENGQYYLDSVAYQEWLNEGQPTEGALYDTVNEQSLMVTGYGIEDYQTYIVNGEPVIDGNGQLKNPERTGLQQVESAEPGNAQWDAMNDFVADNFASGDSSYLDAVSSTFIVFCQGELGATLPDDPTDSQQSTYSQDMTLFNNIASTVSAKANTEEQPSSNEINTEGSIIQQTTSAMDVITGCNKQMQDVFSSMISSMGKF